MKILFITSTYIGDAAVSSGILAHLIARHPDARVTIACGRPAASLFGAVPGLDRVLPIVKRRAKLHWFDLWRSCIGTRWDIVVDLRGSIASYLLRARERRVFRPRAKHGARRIAEWGAVIGLETLPPPKIWTGPEQDAAAARLLPDAPVLALGASANWYKKIWPAARFAELIQRLTSAEGILPNAHVALLGMESERASLQPLLDAIPAARLVDLIGKTDLATGAAVLKRSSLFIGNDSGLLYMAVAAGVPAVGLLGPTPGLFGPDPGETADPLHELGSWARRLEIVRTTTSYEALIETSFHTDHVLMETLSVDMAEAGARRLWARVGGPTAAGAAIA